MGPGRSPAHSTCLSGVGTLRLQAPGAVSAPPPLPHSLTLNVREGLVEGHLLIGLCPPGHPSREALRASRRPRWQRFFRVCKPQGSRGSPGPSALVSTLGPFRTTVLGAPFSLEPWQPAALEHPLCATAACPTVSPAQGGARVPGPEGGALDTAGARALAGSMGLCSQGIQGCVGRWDPHLVCKCQKLSGVHPS